MSRWLVFLPAATLLAGLIFPFPLLFSSSALAQRDDGALTPPTLTAPLRMAATSNGTLLVTDHLTRRVFELDPADLSIQRSIRIDGRPLAVACGGGSIYVGNESTRRVDVLDMDGNLRHHLGGPECTFGQPNDIALDLKLGLVMVVDSTENTVKIFRTRLSESGSLVRTIPATPDPNVLAHPTAIAIDPEARQILVSDFGATESGIDPKVQVFDYSGNLLQTISGKSGMTGYRFSRPQGLALDAAGGRIFLTASWLGTVLVLDRATGSTLSTLGTYGSDPGQLALPVDIEILGPSHDVYVVSSRPGRIEVFPQGGAIR